MLLKASLGLGIGWKSQEKIKLRQDIKPETARLTGFLQWRRDILNKKKVM